MPVQFDPNSTTYYPVTSSGDMQPVSNPASQAPPPQTAQAPPPPPQEPPPPPSTDPYVGSLVDTVV